MTRKTNIFQKPLFWKKHEDSPKSPISKPTSHLYVLVPGMWGTPSDLKCLLESVEEKKGSQDLILVSSANAKLKSYHGIDVCGSRLAREVKKYVRSKSKEDAKITEISFIGFSAGGIFARYAIGVLHKQKFFQKISPACYISISSPHMGTRQSNSTKLGQFWNVIGDSTSNVVGGRSMDQLCLVDEQYNPLMLQISLPNSIFVAGLSLFRCTIYASAKNDNVVPFCTAGLAKRNPYRPYSSRQIQPLPGYKYICREAVININEDIERVEVNDNAPVIAEQCLPDWCLFHGFVLPYWVCQGACILPIIRPCSGSFDEKDVYSPGKNPAVEMSPDQDFVSLNGNEGTTKNSKRFSMATEEKTEPCSNQSSFDTEELSVVTAGQIESSKHMPIVSKKASEDFSPILQDSKDKSSLDSKNEIPMKIRENLLAEISFTRVDCCIPGIHTHSKMIMREGLECYNEGKEIMRHVALKVTTPYSVAAPHF